MLTAKEDVRLENDTAEGSRWRGRRRVLLLMLAVALIIAGTLCALNRARTNPAAPKQAMATTALPGADVTSSSDAQPSVSPTISQPGGEATAESPAPTQESVATTDTPVPTQESVAATPTTDLPIAPVPGSRAPDFTLSDLDGKEWALSELTGKAVMLNFWTTW